MVLSILEHHSPEYPGRTIQNVNAADVTVGFAVDFSTAGERLTAKSAGQKFVPIDFDIDEIDAARILYRHMRAMEASTLNVAGNSVFTLSRKGFSQEFANQWVWHVIRQVHQHRPIAHIYSGGQTGIDLAGAVAGVILGIPTTVTLPAKFRQRHSDNRDYFHTEEEIRHQIIEGADELILPPR